MKLFLAFLILGSAGVTALAWGWGVILTAPSAVGVGSLVLGLVLWAAVFLYARFELRRAGR